ncbi:benzoate/H(+) symporter BenE family transporter [Calidifontibacter indicus]|uniref:benzoate/H(+) symporter BenE family transporter n=1 Tax=Calidifontibacter indicus TaxID=419650 RepID=UPI00319DB073
MDRRRLLRFHLPRLRPARRTRLGRRHRRADGHRRDDRRARPAGHLRLRRYAALGEERSREAGAIALVVAASGITIAGVGSAFWGLVAGLVLYAVLARR